MRTSETVAERLPYLRHRNGSGRLYDNSEACERSYIDRESDISDGSSVWSSKICGSRVLGSVVSESLIKDSYITNSDIHGGTIEGSVIACEYVGGNAKVLNSHVLGKSRVAHRAVCQNVRFRDLTVKGAAVLENWPDETFDGCQGYVCRGVWHRPPRVVRLDFGVTVTESVPDYAFVACVEFPIARWLVIGDRYGLRQSWSLSQIDQVRRFLEELVVTSIPL